MRMELRSKALDKLYKRRDRMEMPDYQREEVWTTSEKRKLIDTILRGWHLPKLYFRKIGDGTLECVDGQQRLVAIWEFYDDKLALGPDSAAEFGGSVYSELPDDASDDFDDFELDIEEIEHASDEDLRQLFLRLQLGKSLTTAEKLNAVSGNVRDFCKWAAEQPFFADKIALRDTRFAHFYIVTQWVYVEARGVTAQMRLPQLQDFFETNRNLSLESDLVQRIKAALEYLDAAFPDKSTKLRNRSNVFSVCMLASKVISQRLEHGTAKEFGEFVDSFFTELANEVEKGAKSTDNEFRRYQEAVSGGSAAGESIRTRINILVRRLSTSYTAFAPLLGSDPSLEDETRRALEEKADAVAELVYSLNGTYAAKTGDDLFKMTNESSKAIITMRVPCKSAGQYGELIDGLYFLVYEGSGSGNRLPTPLPTFVQDIRDLRTDIRHDVDHGGRRDVVKKRRKMSAAFHRYSGKGSPSECGPEEFLAMQFRLLDAMGLFLKAL